MAIVSQVVRTSGSPPPGTPLIQMFFYYFGFSFFGFVVAAIVFGLMRIFGKRTHRPKRAILIVGFIIDVASVVGLLVH